MKWKNVIYIFLSPFIKEIFAKLLYASDKLFCLDNISSVKFENFLTPFLDKIKIYHVICFIGTNRMI